MVKTGWGGCAAADSQRLSHPLTHTSRRATTSSPTQRVHLRRLNAAKKAGRGVFAPSSEEPDEDPAIAVTKGAATRCMDPRCDAAKAARRDPADPVVSMICTASGDADSTMMHSRWVAARTTGGCTARPWMHEDCFENLKAGARMHAHTHAHARTHARACTHTRTRVHAATRAHARTNAHTHTHAHTRTHTRTVCS